MLKITSSGTLKTWPKSSKWVNRQLKQLLHLTYRSNNIKSQPESNTQAVICLFFVDFGEDLSGPEQI